MNELDPPINNEPGPSIQNKLDTLIQDGCDRSCFQGAYHQPIYEGPFSKPKPSYYFYRAEDENRKVEADNILYLEAKDNYVLMHFPTGKPLIIRSTLEGLSREFPVGMFLRISRTYCAAAGHITAWTKTYVKIGEKELPVSKSYYTILEDRFEMLGTY